MTSFSGKQFIEAMRRFPGAVNIVTTGTGDKRAGFTATACISLTAEPPQVGIAVNRSVSAYPRLVENGSYCINTLASDQHALAGRFSGPIKGVQRFDEGHWTVLRTGAPVLDGAVVNFDCEMSDQMELSTHTLFVGRVVAVRQSSDARSLLYADGDWGSLLHGTSRDMPGLLQDIGTVVNAIEHAEQQSSDPLTNLETFVRAWTKIYTDRHRVAPKYMSAELYVSPSDVLALNAARREFDDRLTALLVDGVEANRFQIEEPRLMAFAISGLVGWVHRWFRPDGRLTPEQIGEHLALLVRKMVERSDVPATASNLPASESGAKATLTPPPR
jgi:flavin reductase